KDLAGAGLVVRDESLRLHGCHAVGEEGAGLHLDRALRDLVTNRRALRLQLRPAPGGVEKTLDGTATAGERLDAAALEVQRDSHVVPAAVLFADELVRRDADVLEEDLVEAVAVGEVDQGPYRDARALHVEDEHGDALVLGRRRIGAGGKPAPVG